MQTAYVGMGANLESVAGAPEQTLAAAADRLRDLGRVTRRSSLYSTEPVGFADQPRFLNAVVEVQTDLSPRKLLAGLLRIELEFGRDRSAGIQNGPRTLDLDVLLFGSLVLHEAELDVPHPRLAERAFVLVPLCEIASRAVDPRTGATVKELLERLYSNSPHVRDSIFPLQSVCWRADPDGLGPAGVRADARDGDR